MFLGGMSDFTEVPHQKYWIQRYNLFSSWREGIRLDYESWYSVTPHTIAVLQAKRNICRSLQQKIPLLAVDAFSGSGSNSAEFASAGVHVISCEINISRAKMVKFNIDKYFLGNKVDLICANFLTLCPILKPDLIFLSPPWGGPDYYVKSKSFKLENMYIGKLNGIEILEKALEITPNVIYFLPKNTDLGQIQSRIQIPWEIDFNFVKGRLKAVTIYFGSLIGLAKNNSRASIRRVISAERKAIDG